MKKLKIKKKYIKNKGITLISLIVTIIILLILAGITISVLIGDEGVVNKTSLIIKEQEYKAEREVLEQDVINIRNKNIGKVPIAELDEEFRKNDLVDGDTENCTELLCLNGSTLPNGIVVHTKKGYDHFFDGESMLTIDEFESKYPYYRPKI